MYLFSRFHIQFFCFFQTLIFKHSLWSCWYPYEENINKLLRSLRGDRRICGGKRIDVVRLDIVRLELFIPNLKTGFDTKEIKIWKANFDDLCQSGNSKSIKTQAKIDFWDQKGSPRRPSCAQSPQVEAKGCPKSPKSITETSQDPQSCQKLFKSCKKWTKNEATIIKNRRKNILRILNDFWEDIYSTNL